MNWRSALEKRFVFNPAKSIDPSHFLKMDQEIQKVRADLQNKLEKALVELKQASQQITYLRHQQQPMLQDLAAKFSQTKADFEAVCS